MTHNINTYTCEYCKTDIAIAYKELHNKHCSGRKIQTSQIPSIARKSNKCLDDEARLREAFNKVHK